MKLATHLQNLGCQYRIITPYEAQRSGIEEAMKAADLEWGDKVFNVDSFQGLLTFFDFHLMLDSNDPSSVRQRGGLYHHISRTIERTRIPEELAQDQCHAYALQAWHVYLLQPHFSFRSWAILARRQTVQAYG